MQGKLDGVFFSGVELNSPRNKYTSAMRIGSRSDENSCNLKIIIAENDRTVKDIESPIKKA